MAFLFSPKARAFSDESLESYLLRVVSENFFDSYEGLSLAIREELHELDFEAHGAFPIDLKRLNVYHAKHNSHFRMRALCLLETLLDLPRYELQKLALLKSDIKFNSSAALYKNGVDIPHKFIRYHPEDAVASIPVCPQCLAEEAYIKQNWHIKWVKECTKHQCALLHNCPECCAPINYIENESITHCSCGFELSCASISPANTLSIEHLNKLLDKSERNDSNPLFNNTTLTERFAALLWYQERYSQTDNFCLDDVVDYFSKWPAVFYKELDELSENAEMKLIYLFNKTEFKFIFGDAILACPSTQMQRELHFIYRALLDYLVTLVEGNPKAKKPNTADLLVSVLEAATLLGTSVEQVYRLYQDGILQTAFRHKMNQRINPYKGVFFLRHVIEYKTSFGNDKARMYLSAW
ncbi:TniQ family protein [Pseudoalteromonas sp. SWN166]|uniref:TniQ family protein n=1 Tax=Pseudoalteromonas sp. SWN166 TaxID=2792061 RepID=UPI0018CD3186|nr:TniQ family protein [Pseudoalteromonas sp. SWN166]MBH0040623.1 TniQ family protein [Pseudoalteromonas sp. SWN166]